MAGINTFIINGKHLEMGKVLVHFEIPILFTCTYGKEVYLCCCTDAQECKYLVMKTNYQHIINMMEDKILLTEAFNGCEEFYCVTAGNTIEEDITIKLDSLSDEFLPQEGAYYYKTDSDKEILEYFKTLLK